MEMESFTTVFCCDCSAVYPGLLSAIRRAQTISSLEKSLSLPWQKSIYMRCCNLIGWLKILSSSHENLAIVPRRIFPSLPPPTFAHACAYTEKYGWLARLTCIYVYACMAYVCTCMHVLYIYVYMSAGRTLCLCLSRDFLVHFYTVYICINIHNSY